MATIFAFDAASSRASCALLVDGTLAGERLSDPRSLLAATAELTAATGIGLAEIDALVVGTGPGSFTSIRIGLATARALGFALAIPAAGVSSLRAYAGGTPVLDARRGEVFTDGPAVGRPDELLVDGLRLIGDGALRYRELFERAGAEVPPDDDPRHRPAAALLVAHASAYTDAALLEPLYVRRPDATPAP